MGGGCMGRYDGHASAIVTGVADAWHQYTRWCGSYDVQNSGIEAYISVKIAQRLHREFRDTCRVWLEPGVRKVLDLAGYIPQPGALPKDLRVEGRIDVAFCDSEGRARGVIEVKRHFAPSNFTSDIKRINRLLDRAGGLNGHLRWGVVTAMHLIHDHVRHDPRARLQKFGEEAQAAAGQRTVSPFFSTPRLPQAKLDGTRPKSAVGIGYLIV